MSVPRLSEKDVRKRLEQRKGWERSGEAIRRCYAFADFKAAIAFVSRVAALAEEANHHPDILVEYNKVTLTLSTHDSGGLTERDFALAARIDSP